MKAQNSNTASVEASQMCEETPEALLSLQINAKNGHKMLSDWTGAAHGREQNPRLVSSITVYIASRK